MLVKLDFAGKKVEDLLGQRDLSLDEAVAVIGPRIGMPDLKYLQFPHDDAEKGMRKMELSADVTQTSR